MTSELRIALFSGNYGFQPDGANKTLNKLVDYLERQSIEVLIFSPTTDVGAFDAVGTIVSVPSIPIPMRPEYRIGSRLSGPLKRQLLDFQPTLMHLSTPDITGHSALNFAHQQNIPVVSSFHTRFDTYVQYYGLGWLAPYCRKRMAMFYSRCQHVYVPSPSMGQILQAQNIVGDNVRNWSRGINCAEYNPDKRDMAWRQSLGISDEDIVLGFVGRLVKEKGFNLFADLVETLSKRGLPVKALIVGDGPEREQTERRLPGAIFTGHVSGPELWRAYASCDLFINPSKTETFGNVTLEAMASGLPTICLNATGSLDLVEHGQTGWLIDSEDISDWADKTSELVLDGGLRRSMGQQARLRSQNYNWDTIMQSMVGYYYEAVQARAQPAYAMAE